MFLIYLNIIFKSQRRSRPAGAAVAGGQQTSPREAGEINRSLLALVLGSRGRSCDSQRSYSRVSPPALALPLALALARAIAGEWKRDLGKVGVFGRRGLVGERKKKEMGLLAVRAGDTVGDRELMDAVAAIKEEEEARMKLYCGIDLHSALLHF